MIFSKTGEKEEQNQQNGVTKAIFFRQKDGTMSGYILRFISDRNYKNKGENNYKKLSLKSINNFSGYIVFSNWNGKTLDVYKYINGKIISSTQNRKPAANPNGRMSNCEQTVVSYQWACITVYYQCCTEAEYDYDPGSVCCSRNYKYCDLMPVYGEVCTPDNPTEPGTGGGDGDGWGDQPGPTAADIIIDPNLNDCIKGIINKTTVNEYQNYLIKRILDVFGSNAGAQNLKFMAGNGNGKPAYFDPNQKAIIIDEAIVSQSSNEYVAAILFHEEIHAILDQFNNTSFLGVSQFDQHKQMFTGWVSDISTALRVTYPTLGQTDATGLALNGFADVVLDKNQNLRPNLDAFAQEKYGTSLAVSSTVTDDFKSGRRGSKCN